MMNYANKLCSEEEESEIEENEGQSLNKLQNIEIMYLNKKKDDTDI